MYGRDDGTGTAPQAGLDTGGSSVGGIWDIASFSQPSNKNSINFGTGTSQVVIRTAGAPGGTITNNSGNFTNSVMTSQGQIYPVAPSRASVVVGVSPFVCQNKSLQPFQVIATGGTISTFQIGTDGSNYDTYGVNTPYVLFPGMYAKTTYSVLPTMFLYCSTLTGTNCQCN